MFCRNVNCFKYVNIHVFTLVKDCDCNKRFGYMQCHWFVYAAFKEVYQYRGRNKEHLKLIFIRYQLNLVVKGIKLVAELVFPHCILTSQFI